MSTYDEFGNRQESAIERARDVRIAALLAERDELREALRSSNVYLVDLLSILDNEGEEGAPDGDELVRRNAHARVEKTEAILSRHPSQPVKGTP